ncbi:MAG: hypothetical protein HY707_02185 [Ignavibacteriae bacterium]|nr:hypothetical protein [Ignavibacteriota bacterium]
MNHKTFFAFIVIFTILFLQDSSAQLFKLDANVELTATTYNPNTDPERTINRNFRDDDPFNPARGKLFPHLRFTNTFGFEAEVLFDNRAKKFDRSRNAQVRPDGFFVSVRGLIDNRLNFWLGRIPTPVGTFSPRSYSHVNPLIGYPLAYHYKVPYNVFVLSSEAANLFLRDNNVGAGTSIYEACWITGLTAFGDIESFDYMLAIGRGTLTNPEASANKGFQVAGHVGKTINQQFSLGISAGIAPYLEKESGLPTGVRVRDPKHFIAGFDVAAHLQKLHLIAEAFYNSWDTPQYMNEKSIHAYTWYLEGQYFILSNLYVATRFDQMLYDDITDPSTRQKTPWGYDVTRVEGGLGYRFIPQLNIKAVVQYNKLAHPSTKEITLLAFQTAFRFEDIQKIFGLDGSHKTPY